MVFQLEDYIIAGIFVRADQTRNHVIAYNTAVKVKSTWWNLIWYGLNDLATTNVHISKIFMSFAKCSTNNGNGVYDQIQNINVFLEYDVPL